MVSTTLNSLAPARRTPVQEDVRRKICEVVCVYDQPNNAPKPRRPKHHVLPTKTFPTQKGKRRTEESARCILRKIASWYRKYHLLSPQFP